MKKYQLEFDSWDETCGDGCCYSYFTEVLVNGKTMVTFEYAPSELYEEMKHFVDLLNAGEESFVFDLTETLEIDESDRVTDGVGCLNDATMLNGILLSTTYYTNNPFGLVLTGLGIGYRERVWSSDAHPMTYENMMKMALELDEEREYDESGHAVVLFDRYLEELVDRLDV